MNELQLQTIPPLTGITAYAVLSTSSAQYWNTSTLLFEAYNAANQANYAIAMTATATLGEYQGNFPTAIATADTYSVTVYRQAGGSPVDTDNVIGFGSYAFAGGAPTGASLISLAYAKQYLGIGVTTYDALLTALISAASGSIVDYCHNPIIITDYAEYYDLPQSAVRLPLNNYPVTALTSVTLYPYESSPIVIDGSDYIVSSSGIIQAKPTSSAYRFFPQGFQSVYVAYSAGFNPVPSAVQLATAETVQHLYYASSKDTTLDSERLGDYNYKLRADAFIGITDSVMNKLAPYRRGLVW